jgi:hypothetical protein
MHALAGRRLTIADLRPRTESEIIPRPAPAVVATDHGKLETPALDAPAPTPRRPGKLERKLAKHGLSLRDLNNLTTALIGPIPQRSIRAAGRRSRSASDRAHGGSAQQAFG